jgi:hypothetical protein
MSGTRGAYEPLRQTQRELESGREAGSPRNYDALRQTQQEVDARPAPVVRDQPEAAASNPYENVEERKAAYSEMLAGKVKDGRIDEGEKTRAESLFENKIKVEQNIYTKQQQAEALDRLAAVRAQNGPDRQHEQQKELER